MNKKVFFRWYIKDGLKEFLVIWKRLVIFIPKYFSILLLLRTLISPWHRDVSFKNWRGFNPIKSMEKIAWNFFARIIGAIVRFVVIIIGLIVWVFVAVLVVLFYFYIAQFLSFGLCLLCCCLRLIGFGLYLFLYFLLVLYYLHIEFFVLVVISHTQI